MIRVSNSLELDQARRFEGPDLVPNCSQCSSADEISRQRINFLSAEMLKWNLSVNAMDYTILVVNR